MDQSARRAASDPPHRRRHGDHRHDRRRRHDDPGSGPATDMHLASTAAAVTWRSTMTGIALYRRLQPGVQGGPGDGPAQSVCRPGTAGFSGDGGPALAPVQQHLRPGRRPRRRAAGFRYGQLARSATSRRIRSICRATAARPPSTCRGSVRSPAISPSPTTRTYDHRRGSRDSVGGSVIA